METAAYEQLTIAYFRAVLLAQRVEAMARLQRNSHPIYVEEELGGSERINKFQIIERHGVEAVRCREQLDDVEKALRKCEDGTYGICSDCRALIALARLRAIPTASRCVPCQKHKKTV